MRLDAIKHGKENTTHLEKSGIEDFDKKIGDFFIKYHRKFEPHLNHDYFPNVPQSTLDADNQELATRKAEHKNDKPRESIALETCISALLHTDALPTPLEFGTNFRIVDLPSSDYDETVNGKDLIFKFIDKEDQNDLMYLGIDATTSQDENYDKKIWKNIESIYLHGQSYAKYFNDFDEESPTKEVNGEMLMPQVVINISRVEVDGLTTSLTTHYDRWIDKIKPPLDKDQIEKLKKVRDIEPTNITKELYKFSFKILDQTNDQLTTFIKLLQKNISSIKNNPIDFKANAVKEIGTQYQTPFMKTDDKVLLERYEKGLESYLKVQSTIKSLVEKMNTVYVELFPPTVQQRTGSIIRRSKI